MSIASLDESALASICDFVPDADTLFAFALAVPLPAILRCAQAMNEKMRTPLDACCLGSMSAFKRLAATGEYILHDCLNVAARRGSLLLVQTILDVSSRYVDERCYTRILRSACECGHVHLMEFALAAGAEIEQGCRSARDCGRQEFFGFFRQHVCMCEYHRVPSVTAYPHRSADTIRVSHFTMIPAGIGEIETFKMCEAGIEPDVECANSVWISAGVLGAIVGGHAELVARMIERGAFPINTARVARKNDKIDVLVRAAPLLSAKNREHMMNLACAVAARELVRALIDLGVRVSLHDLQMACMSENAGFVREIRELCADDPRTDPLYRPTSSLEILEMQLAWNAKPAAYEVVNACWFAPLDVVKRMFAETEASIGQCLYCARLSGNVRVIEWLESLAI